MNSSELDKIIEGLKEHSGSNVSYELAWKEIKKIGESFKSVRYPTVDEKNQAWDRFQTMVAQIKQSQNRPWETERFSETSKKFKEKILAQIVLAKPPCGIEEAFGATVLKPLNIVSNVADATLPWPPIKDSRKIMEDCSAQLKSGWAIFNLHKKDMTGKDKHEAYNSLNNVHGRLNEAWDKWRDIKKQGRKKRTTERK